MGAKSCVFPLPWERELVNLVSMASAQEPRLLASVAIRPSGSLVNYLPTSIAYDGRALLYLTRARLVRTAKV